MTVFKKTYVRELPDAAEIVTRKGKQVAQWTDRRGKKRTAEVTTAKDGSLRIKVKAANYTAKYRDGEERFVKPPPDAATKTLPTRFCPT